MHCVVLNPVSLNRTEGAETHVKSHVADFNALFLEGTKNIVCEVKSCCRGCGLSQWIWEIAVHLI